MRKNGVIHSKEHTRSEIKCQMFRFNCLDLMLFVEKPFSHTERLQRCFQPFLLSEGLGKGSRKEDFIQQLQQGDEEEALPLLKKLLTNPQASRNALDFDFLFEGET